MFSYLHVVAGGILVGKVALLSFVVAPILAKHLDAASFGRVVRALFPAYYAMGMIMALGALVALAGLALVRGPSAGVIVACGLWLVILWAEAHCRFSLMPRSNLMRDQLKAQEQRGHVDPILQAEWERVHRRSVALNSVVLVIGFCLLGLATTMS